MRPDDQAPRPEEREPDALWLTVADRIATGEHIDWEALARELDVSQGSDMLRQLRTLASIGQLHTSTDLPAGPWPDASPTNLTAGGRWGSLELIEELGRGSFGTVWRARDPRLDREVALKLLHPSRQLDDHDRSRFLEEGRALARLDHTHIVRIHGAEEHGGQVGLWMEMVRGKNLARLVRDQGTLSAEEAALIGERVARALAAVHEKGVVHRDVKAHNVMRAEGGRVVLMDFGAATTIDPAGIAATMTGTPFYLAPELLEGHAADARSDLYALGVLLYHLVTGAYPIEAAQVGELRQMHREGKRRHLADARADLPSNFVAVVETALAGDPRDRFTSAGAMAQALASLSGTSVRRADTESLSRQTGRVDTSRRRGPLSSFGLAAIVAVIALSAVLSGRIGRSAPLAVEASLLRFGDHTTEELYSGARVAVGDELGLRVRTSHESWVYVLNRDDEERFHVMFPQLGLAAQNPLAADQEHDLPGRVDGELQSWLVDTAGGEEQVLVVVARAPVEAIESRLGAFESLPPQTLEGLRGIGQTVQRTGGNASAGAASDLFAAVDELSAGTSKGSDGAWIRRIVLRNPR